MANMKNFYSQLLFLTLFSAALVVQGSRLYIRIVGHPRVYNHIVPSVKGELIGSVVPTCSFNECKGCKYKCRAEQVPVEGNDPINSPYHYKCVCHR